MDKKLFKHLILLITYAVVLVVVIVKIDTVAGWLSAILSAFQPLFIGFAVAFVLNRPCNFFARLYEGHLPAGPAGCAASGGGHRLCNPAGHPGSAHLPSSARADQQLADLCQQHGHLCRQSSGVVRLGVQTLDLEALADLNLSAIINDTLNKVLSGVLDALTTTVPHLISMTGVVVSAVVTGVLALVFSIYMLIGGPRLTAQCRRLAITYLPGRVADPLLSVTRLTADTFTRYVSGQLTEACILGVLCFLGMCLFQFDYAPLISVIIGVSALIPVAGAYIGAAVAVLLLVMIEPMQAVWFLIFLVVLQQLEGNIIYPRVVGTSLGPARHLGARGGHCGQQPAGLCGPSHQRTCHGCALHPAKRGLGTAGGGCFRCGHGWRRKRRKGIWQPLLIAVCQAGPQLFCPCNKRGPAMPVLFITLGCTGPETAWSWPAGDFR